MDQFILKSTKVFFLPQSASLCVFCPRKNLEKANFYATKRIGAGALILFNKCLLVEVEDVNRYASFADMLKAESLDKVLPRVKTIEEGVQIYRKFYTEEKESSHGVLAISVSELASQPYIPLATKIFGLSYEGIESLLGLTHPRNAFRSTSSTKNSSSILISEVAQTKSIHYLIMCMNVSCS